MFRRTLPAVELHLHHHSDNEPDHENGAQPDNRDHRLDEHTVPLIRVATMFEADVIVASLQARGITAGAIHSRGAGIGGNVESTVGHQVLVFEKDLETARAIIAENDTHATPESADAT